MSKKQQRNTRKKLRRLKEAQAYQKKVDAQQDRLLSRKLRRGGVVDRMLTRDE